MLYRVIECGDGTGQVELELGEEGVEGGWDGVELGQKVVVEVRVGGGELAISHGEAVEGQGEDAQQAEGALQLVHEVGGDENELGLEVEVAAGAVFALVEHKHDADGHVDEVCEQHELEDGAERGVERAHGEAGHAVGGEGHEHVAEHAVGVRVVVFQVLRGLVRVVGDQPQHEQGGVQQGGCFFCHGCCVGGVCGWRVWMACVCVCVCAVVSRQPSLIPPPAVRKHVRRRGKVAASGHKGEGRGRETTLGPGKNSV